MQVLLGEADDYVWWARDKQHMNPNKGMEDPACGWRLGAFAFLVAKRGSMRLERGAHTVLQGRIHQHTPS